MREYKIEKWCDTCWQDGEQKTLATHTFVAGVLESEKVRPAIKLVEACETHAKPLLELIALLEHAAPFQQDTGPSPRKKDEAARKTSAGHKPPSALASPCPICDTWMTRSALINHVWHLHRAEEVRPPAPLRCPDCGQVGESVQGTAQHRRFIHGHDALAEALAGVPGYKPPK